MNVAGPNLIIIISYATNAHAIWIDLQEGFDKVNDTRCYNLHKEIATLSQGTSSVFVYCSKLKDLWNEAKALVSSPGCDYVKSRGFIVHLRKQKLYQFFMGLNDSYSQTRSQILMIKPIPSIIQAYVMLVSDESQRTVAATAGILGPLSNVHYESTALYNSKPLAIKSSGRITTYIMNSANLKETTKKTAIKLLVTRSTLSIRGKREHLPQLLTLSSQ
ncbi:PREDICTED: uncharacterized protein LOC109235951 [Nicotiana attenuata]|uniref:uncharacterized protein LOC109235951 n=1 Tax=Nicotiana attenuata TaxID=49451 RepID=UPI000905D87A|nr:PREDICTED: uncharacterized protein LOC109235951 [Nicotiana attenuata]